MTDLTLEALLGQREEPSGQAPQPYVAFLHKVLSSMLARLNAAEVEVSDLRRENDATFQCAEDRRYRAKAAERERDAHRAECRRLEEDNENLRARLRLAEGIAYGMDCVATSSEVAVLELLAEVDRLKALVVALWQGGEWLWEQVNDARSWAGRFALGGRRLLLEAARLDLELEAERGKAWQAWCDLAHLEECWTDLLNTAHGRQHELDGAHQALRSLLSHLADLCRCHACPEPATRTVLLANRRAHACDQHGEGGDDLPRAEVVRMAKGCLGC